jgi:hypothetical protein
VVCIALISYLGKGIIMSKEKVWEINDGWRDELKENGYHEFYMNEPFSEEYWKEKYKIVFCNVNHYGYNDPEDDYALSWKLFEKWFDNPSETLRWTGLFIYCLYNKLFGKTCTRQDLQKVDTASMKNTMKKITYMNLLKEVSKKHIDKEVEEEMAFFYFTHEWNSRNQKDLIEALEPNIFIITSDIGLQTINKMYSDVFTISKQGIAKYEKKFFVHLYHPSTSQFNYDYILIKVNEIVNEINKV